MHLKLNIVEFTNEKTGGTSYRVRGGCPCPRTRERFGFKSPTVRRNFPSLEGAEKFKHDVETFAASGSLRFSHHQTSLTEGELRDAEVAIGLLQGRGTLKAAANAYLATLAPEIADGLFIEALNDFAKAKGSREARTVQSLVRTARHFAKVCGVVSLSDITLDAVTTYLERKSEIDGTDLSRRTKRNNRAQLHNVCGWLHRAGRLESNPVSLVSEYIVKTKEPEVMTASQADALLRAAEADHRTRGKHLGYYVLGLFAGLRPEAELGKNEVEHAVITWDDIEIDAADPDLHEIRITKTKATGAPIRSVPINPTLRKWLLHVRELGGDFVSPNRASNDRIRNAAGVRESWAVDIMRHSFATYSMGAGVNEFQLAGIMGNSPRMVREHYANIGKHTRPEAKRFWSISPTPA